ncbi:hypothetical protein TNCV_116701 [Trichonephila clavipes]|nr:hypothetical protein TNCV_116701 [Trichonephila clavipes]
MNFKETKSLAVRPGKERGTESKKCCFTNVRCQMLVRVLTKTLRPLDCKFGLLRDGAIRTMFQDGSYNNN